MLLGVPLLMMMLVLGAVAVRSAAGLESLLIFVEMKIINALRIRTNFF